MHNRKTKERLLQVGDDDVSTPTDVNEVLAAELLHSGSALVTGGFVQQEKESNSWKLCLKFI